MTIKDKFSRLITTKVYYQLIYHLFLTVPVLLIIISPPILKTVSHLQWIWVGSLIFYVTLNASLLDIKRLEKNPGRYIVDHFAIQIAFFGYLSMGVISIVVYAFLLNNFRLEILFSPEPVMKDTNIELILKNAIVVPFAIAYSTLFNTLAIKFRRSNPYYLAKAYVKRSANVGNDPKIKGDQRLRDFIKGLNSYNTFLEKSFDIEINGLQRFYSKITCDSEKSQKDTEDLLSNMFRDDRLQPARELRNIMGVKNPERFLIKEKAKIRKLDWLPTVAAAAIPPVVILILRVVFPGFMPANG